MFAVLTSLVRNMPEAQQNVSTGWPQDATLPLQHEHLAQGLQPRLLEALQVTCANLI